MREENVEQVPHIVPPPLPKGKALYLRKINSIKEEILSRPTFFDHFDKVVVDWKFFRRREKDVFEKEVQWIKRQKLGIIVDLSSGINLYPDVDALEKKSPQEKWAFFHQLIAPCTRCYACRNACPLCYCPTCFVDESQPQWVGKSIDATDTMTFHFLRAYHCAGRCTDCGACERVCPVDIPVRQFTNKLNKDVLELFGWEAGMDPEKRPPLDVYQVNDYNDFVK